MSRARSSLDEEIRATALRIASIANIHMAERGCACPKWCAYCKLLREIARSFALLYAARQRDWRRRTRGTRAAPTAGAGRTS